jgi:hypothetical protein
MEARPVTGAALKRLEAVIRVLRENFSAFAAAIWFAARGPNNLRRVRLSVARLR